jgi:DNA-binding response OmpR family regulator
MDVLRAGRVDLLILDVSMPGMSGLDVLREMGAEGMLPGTPVLMFSASEEYREKSLILGAAAFVLKHEADDLIEQIERLLRCKGVPPEARGRALRPEGSGPTLG